MAKPTLRRPSNFIDLTGQQFGRLRVVRYHGVDANGSCLWDCACECGASKAVNGAFLRRGLTCSCGCLRKGVIGNITRTHGMSKTPEYRSWAHMKGRCLDRNDKKYPRYGARGITVCDRWRDSFEAFLEDMGPRPSAKHSIDRINNDGNYEPGNCRWATTRQQGQNTSRIQHLTFQGATKPLSEWARDLGVDPRVIWLRLRHGWTVERALTTPLRKRPRRRQQGQ